MHHGDPAHIDLAGIAADQDDFGGDRHGADQGCDFTGAEADRTAVGAGQQHQAGEGQADAQARHQAWPTAQHQPLQQGHERHVQGRDKSRLAAGDGLQAHGLQAIAEHDRSADEDPGLEFGQGQPRQRLERHQADEQGRGGEAQANEKHRAADGHDIVHQQEGAAPQHGDDHQHQFGFAQTDIQRGVLDHGLARRRRATHNAPKWAVYCANPISEQYSAQRFQPTRVGIATCQPQRPPAAACG
ncbi:hypothetical protein D9M71_383880 [compost metagenome]